MQANCLQCGRNILIKPGHRKRLYCSERCKQTAYRRRHGHPARRTSSENKYIKRAMRIQQMKKIWPDLDFSTYLLLQDIEEKHGESLAKRVAEVILRELRNRNTPL